MVVLGVIVVVDVVALIVLVCLKVDYLIFALCKVVAGLGLALIVVRALIL